MDDLRLVASHKEKDGELRGRKRYPFENVFATPATALHCGPLFRNYALRRN